MKKVFLSLLLFFSFTSIFAQNPTPDIIYKEWALIAEAQTHLEVSYRVVKCSSSSQAQVHLFIFNESPNDQTAKFDVEITNDSGQKIVQSITFATTKAAMYKAECKSDASVDVLKITLPPDYDPSKISVKATFKP